MVGKYRDMYVITDPHAENFKVAYRYITISRQWLEIMGFWGVPGSPPHDKTSPVPVKPINVPTQDTPEDFAKTGYFTPYAIPTVYQQTTNPTQQNPAITTQSSSTSISSGSFYLSLFISLIFGVALGVMGSLFFTKRHDYSPIR
jgi:hypothetical protein